MADRLTQLQNSLDQLVTQFFSSLNFINQHHPPALPSNVPQHVQIMDVPQQMTNEQFDEAVKELSKDIVTKSKHIETLIDSLPDLENLEVDFTKLEDELQQAREEEELALKERAELLEKCDDLVLRITEYKNSIDSDLT